jgi:hypothetical protein
LRDLDDLERDIRNSLAQVRKKESKGWGGGREEEEEEEKEELVFYKPWVLFAGEDLNEGD